MKTYTCIAERICEESRAAKSGELVPVPELNIVWPSVGSYVQIFEDGSSLRWSPVAGAWPWSDLENVYEWSPVPTAEGLAAFKKVRGVK